MRSKLFSLIGLLFVACAMSPAAAPSPSPALITLNPGYRWTVAGTVGNGSLQGHYVYTTTNSMDAEFYVKVYQAFGFTANDVANSESVRSSLHIQSASSQNVIDLPSGYAGIGSVVVGGVTYTVEILFQISLAFID